MVRRRGKGSKDSSRSKPRPLSRKDGSMKRWEKPSDIPMDEEDQFHASRDRILLDGEDVYSDDEGDEEEVFALKGMPDDSDDSDEGSQQEEEEDDEGGEGDSRAQAPAATKSKSAPKGKQKSNIPPTSDEESQSEEEEESWGRKKSAYYASNADDLESDDEEANEMEEQEARRLQAKARDAMTDEDFGLGDLWETAAAETEADLDEPVPSVQLQSLPQDKQGILRHLQKTNPEALALAGDWDSTARSLIKTQQQLTELESENTLDVVNSGMLHLYYQSLLQYSATLAFYIYLRASDKYAQHPESLRTHPIMSRLLTLKQSITTLEDLGVGEDDLDDDSETDSVEEIDFSFFRKVNGISADELQALLADVHDLRGAMNGAVPDNGEQGKTKAEAHKKATNSEAVEEPPKKKRKTEKKSAAPVTVFDLEEPEFPTKSKTGSRPSASVDTDAFGEPATLQAADAMDKAARKRSLRFHTSKIESASARRERARANAGGDDDIPWRDRQKEKEREQRKAAQKSREMAGEDLDDADPEPRAESSSKKRTRDEVEDADDDEEETGYYDLVKRKSKERKEQKKADYEAAQLAAKEDLLFDESADGPRSVSRAILKNKGLTPSRSKSVRNPRVKKRQRYEKAKKKVSSQKAVFKGGLAATGGRYEGEKSGISKVIKGVRLS